MAPPSGSAKLDNFPWDLQKSLGSGSFGVVWKALDQMTNKVIALKIILVSPEQENKQRREVDVAVKLSHPNLAKVMGAKKIRLKGSVINHIIPEYTNNCSTLVNLCKTNKDADFFCLSMGLCGKDLRSWLESAHNPSSVAIQSTQRQIVEGMLDGLQFLHNQNLIHRDLKPENILFSSPEYTLPVKIGDYGLCRTFKEVQLSDLTSYVGTKLYRAPEINSLKHSFQSDIFSLGLIIWEVLQLLDSKNLRKNFDKLVNDGDHSLINVNAVVAYPTRLITSMTNKNPKFRIKSVVEATLMAGLSISVGTSAELKRILNSSSNSLTINLLEGVYEGSFAIRGNNITLRGEGVEKTFIRQEAGKEFIIGVKGDSCSIQRLSIEGNKGKWRVEGVKVKGRNCTLLDLHVSNCFKGIAVHGRNVNQSSSSKPFPADLVGSSRNSTFYQIDIENCKHGFCAFDPDLISLRNVAIRGAISSGIKLVECNRFPVEMTEVFVYPSTSDAIPGEAKSPKDLKVRKSPNGKLIMERVSLKTSDFDKRSSTCERKILRQSFGQIFTENGGHRVNTI